MSFPRYPRYQDSGVEWLGEVPDPWGVKRLRFVAKVTKGKLPSSTSAVPGIETGLPYLSMDYLRGPIADVVYPSSTESLVCVENGETLLLWDGSNAGEFLKSKRGVVASTLALVETLGVQREFLFFVCKALERQLRDDTTGMGVPHVDGELLRSYLLPIPSATEQAAIAGFLTVETSKIDALIANATRLVDLLEEKRVASLSIAITHGVEPGMPRGAPEVPWFGRVPGHWKVTRLRNACSHIFLGLTSSVDYVDEGGVPLVRALNIAGGTLDLSGARLISKDQHLGLARRNLVRRGDVLLSKSGSIGTAALVESDVEFSIYESIFALRPRPELLGPKYLLYLLRSQPCAAQYAAASVGMGVGHLNMSDVTDVCVAVPPLDEQRKIVAAIESEVQRIDDLGAAARSAIGLLQERRAALILAAVTGQIDVRGTQKAEAA